MYIPEYAKSKDDSLIAELVASYPFVNLVSVADNSEPFISHVPVVTELKDNKIVSVRGHLALRNPHVKFLKENPKATIIYNGPHTYISPLFYKSGRDVPTWNYCVVHLKGTVSFQHDFRDICKNIAELTKVFEGQKPNAWRFELPEDLKNPAQLEAAIVAFELVPATVQAKFKLAQSRPRIDQEGVVEGLSGRSDEMSREVAKLMKKNLVEKI